MNLERLFRQWSYESYFGTVIAIAHCGAQQCHRNKLDLHASSITYVVNSLGIVVHNATIMLYTIVTVPMGKKIKRRAYQRKIIQYTQ